MCVCDFMLMKILNSVYLTRILQNTEIYVINNHYTNRVLAAAYVKCKHENLWLECRIYANRSPVLCEAIMLTVC